MMQKVHISHNRIGFQKGDILLCDDRRFTITQVINGTTLTVKPFPWWKRLWWRILCAFKRWRGGKKWSLWSLCFCYGVQ
jgi:hypothetical protein